jgi:hypothetical protein
MRKKSFIIFPILILFFFPNYKPIQKNFTSYVCVSPYHILNSTTNSSNIIHVKILGTGCDYGVNPPNCINASYDENNFILPGTQYDIDTNIFGTFATTTFVKIILTTNTSFIGKVELYIGGTLVKTNQEIIEQTSHGISYAVPFYCNTVLVKLSN